MAFFHIQRLKTGASGTPTPGTATLGLMAALLSPLAGVGLAASGPPAATYVGRAQCALCHPREDHLWRGSHHDLAMQEATVETVLGDFDDAVFEHLGTRSRFFRRDGRFMVRTDGPDGRLHDYPIRYTFGVTPLQQYLIEFPGGRLQALDIAWDSRPEAQGGQRWFHLHPDQPVPHDDPVHWTGPQLNWNSRCADCHSTDVKKGYDPQTDSYRTRWAELDVSCEACHGPGSTHLAWAAARARGEDPDQGDMGLAVRLDERSGTRWEADPKTGRPKRSRPRSTGREVQVCARCHSRRSQLNDTHGPGQPLMDGYRPELLDAGLYYPDGQIEGEVYVWGSFVQSRMYHAGVSCSDCHDPHSGQLRQPGDQVCTQCHPARRYATPDHHFHSAGSPGASCVGCHMPATTYMQVDPRHDHSLRVPRPDLSVHMDVPNACNACHSDQTPQWAARQVEDWYGHPAQGLQHFAPALDAARAHRPEARALLQALAGDSTQPGIARATGLARLGGYPDRRTRTLLRQAVDSEDPLQRLGALDALGSMGPRQRIMAFPLLWDPLLAVRIEAAHILAPFPPGQLPAAQRAQRDKAIGEYIAAQEFDADRPEAWFNLGGIYTDLGRYDQAERAYRRALDLQQGFVPAYVNLAQLLSSRGRESEASRLLRRGIEADPGQPALEHALALSLIRQQRPEEALPHLSSAARGAPDMPRYSYVYGVALHSAGHGDRALEVLEAAHRRHPGDADILYALATFNRDAGHIDQARHYAHRLQALRPDDPRVPPLIKALTVEHPEVQP